MRLEKRIEGLSETLTTDIKELKNNHSEKNTLNEIGSQVGAVESRVEETED